MRDIVIMLIVLGGLPLILARPWTGILFWSWLGYMNPHRLSWGFAYDFPFSQVVAAATLLGLLFTRDRRGIPMSVLTVVWLLFVAWMTLTTTLALDGAVAWPAWERAIKIQVFALLTIMLIRTRERLIALVWVIALSVGFYGFKGGLFVLRGGGESLVWGPPGTFLGDNNALALAIIMIMPMLWFLFGNARTRLVRVGLGMAILACCASVLGSHSRGAAIAGGVMLLFLWLKGSRKLLIALGLVLSLPVLVVNMPDSWFERMETVSTFEQDDSAMGRIRAWRFGVEMARGRLVGGGFDSFTEQNYRRFAPDITREIVERGDGRFQDAHSIYFKVLGEHGFVGLALFLLVGFTAYRSGSAVLRAVRDRPDLKWAGDLAAMMQVSMVGYAVGGAFLGLSYFDLYYHLVAVIVVLKAIVAEKAVPAAVGGEHDMLDAIRAPVGSRPAGT